MSYHQHPLSAAFPPMDRDEFESLVESIGNIGVQNPITIFDGMVIDGWHRYSAAKDSGMHCPELQLPGDIDPRDFVLAQNKSRRNLSASQRAAAVVSVYQWHPAHRPINTSKGVGVENKGAPGAPLSKTKEEMAVIAGVGVRTISQAKAVDSKGADSVKAAVKNGAISLKSASVVAKLPLIDQEELAAKGVDAMKAFAADENSGPPEYTPLDAANERIEDLQVALAMASMGDVPESEKTMAKDLIDILRAEVKTLTASLDAVSQSRDSLMQEVAQLKKQCQMQRKEIEKLKTSK